MWTFWKVIAFLVIFNIGWFVSHYFDSFLSGWIGGSFVLAAWKVAEMEINRSKQMSLGIRPKRRL